MWRMVIECDAPDCSEPPRSSAPFRPGQGLELVNDLKAELLAAGWRLEDDTLCPAHRQNGKAHP